MKRLYLLICSIALLYACEYESNIPCVEHNRPILREINILKQTDPMDENTLKDIEELKSQLKICDN
jgi:hypothetical protein